MKNLSVKKEFIGACTSVPGIGQIKITQAHASILAQAGRWELLDGDVPNVKKLVPVTKEIDPVTEPIVNKKKSKRNASN